MRIFKRAARFVRGKAFPAAMLSLLMAMTFYKSADLVCIAAENSEPAAIEETVAPSPSSKGFFPVYVYDSGEKFKTLVKGGTVADVFEQLDITISKYDKIDKALDEAVRSGDVVTITRVRFNTVEIRKKLPFKTIAAYSPSLDPKSEKVLNEGEDGVEIQTVKQTIMDGVVAQEEVKESVVEKEPTSRRVIKGFPVKPVSSYDFGYEFDENCEPIGYTSVMRESKSAGYSAPAGASTASGRDAIVGHVAVNPKVIPYGTKLFIKSSDGKHIYGYAIAADTGTALMDGRIAVDLLYATYAESAANGIRNVDIFILGEQ